MHWLRRSRPADAPRFLDVERVGPVLDVRNGLVLGQYPTTSVWLGSAHRLNALMCACSVGLDNAPYVKILSHVRLLTISAHNDEGNWLNPNRVLILWIDISHGRPNLTSSCVYHSICQRCTCHGSSSPRAKLPLSTRWQ